jgi:hypothetical protein
MKKLYMIICLLTMAFAVSFAQEEPKPTKEIRRIEIKHADPMYIYYMLLGGFNFGMQPEMSVLIRGGGYGNTGGNQGDYGNSSYGNNGRNNGNNRNGAGGNRGSQGGGPNNGGK